MNQLLFTSGNVTDQMNEPDTTRKLKLEPIRSCCHIGADFFAPITFCSPPGNLNESDAVRGISTNLMPLTSEMNQSEGPARRRTRTAQKLPVTANFKPTGCISPCKRNKFDADTDDACDFRLAPDAPLADLRFPYPLSPGFPYPVSPGFPYPRGSPIPYPRVSPIPYPRVSPIPGFLVSPGFQILEQRVTIPGGPTLASAYRYT